MNTDLIDVKSHHNSNMRLPEANKKGKWEVTTYSPLSG